MFFFAGNVTDTKTGISKFVPLSVEGKYWRDDKRTRYDRLTGIGVLVKRLKLDTNSVFPIFFTHVGLIKNNLRDSAKTTGNKVFLVRLGPDLWVTHVKDLFHAGHGQHVILKELKIFLGDHRRYLVLSSVSQLNQAINFRKVETYRSLF